MAIDGWSLFAAWLVGVSPTARTKKRALKQIGRQLFFLGGPKPPRELNVSLIAEKAKCCQETVRRLLRELERKWGLICSYRQFGKPNMYSLLRPFDEALAAYLRNGPGQLPVRERIVAVLRALPEELDPMVAVNLIESRSRRDAIVTRSRHPEPAIRLVEERQEAEERRSTSEAFGADGDLLFSEGPGDELDALNPAAALASVGVWKKDAQRLGETGRPELILGWCRASPFYLEVFEPLVAAGALTAGIRNMAGLIVTSIERGAPPPELGQYDATYLRSFVEQVASVTKGYFGAVAEVPPTGHWQDLVRVANKLAAKPLSDFQLRSVVRDNIDEVDDDGYPRYERVLRHIARAWERVSEEFATNPWFGSDDPRDAEPVLRDSMSTGITKLDAMRKGGLHRREIAVLAAHTGLGKTMFLCAVAARAAKANVGVLFLTNEMPEDCIRTRFISALSDVPIDQVSTGAQPDGLLLLQLEVKAMPLDDPDAIAREISYSPKLLILVDGDDFAVMKSDDEVAKAYDSFRSAFHGNQRMWVVVHLDTSTEHSVERHMAVADLGLRMTQTAAQHQTLDGPPIMKFKVAKDRRGLVDDLVVRCEVGFGRGSSGIPSFTPIAETPIAITLAGD